MSDFGERPHGMTRDAWRRLSSAEREAHTANASRRRVEDTEAFDAHMRYAELATPELTWLRNRLLELGV